MERGSGVLPETIQETAKAEGSFNHRRGGIVDYNYTEMKDLAKGEKKQLILERIERGMRNTREIWRDIASTGIVVDISHIQKVLREHDLSDRVDRGVFNNYPTQPYAVSGLTGNRIKNKYLEQVESQGGGFLKTAVYDIETTGLFADFGYVLTCCFKDVDSGEIKVFRLDETKIFPGRLRADAKGQRRAVEMILNFGTLSTLNYSTHRSR